MQPVSWPEEPSATKSKRKANHADQRLVSVQDMVRAKKLQDVLAIRKKAMLAKIASNRAEAAKRAAVAAAKMGIPPRNAGTPSSERL